MELHELFMVLIFINIEVIVFLKKFWTFYNQKIFELNFVKYAKNFFFT